MRTGNIEVAHDAANDLKLLIILLAEAGDVGPRLEQQLRHDGRDALEMAGAKTPAQALGKGSRIDRHGEARRIDFGNARRIKKIASGGGQFRRISLLVARIAREILAWAELRRIDEEARDHALGQLPRPRNECEMARVQRAHGRHERHP